MHYFRSLSTKYLKIRAGYVHRDLKLENVLLENSQTLKTKLVDFGFAE